MTVAFGQPTSAYHASLAMTLRTTSSPVAGIKRNKRVASRPSPFARHARRKSSVQLHEVKAEPDGPLPDIGLSRYICDAAPVESVIQAIRYARQNMLEDIPPRAGMSSTRIAEVLNFRRSLPPLVSVAHIHTLLDAPTKVEREIIELVSSCRVRRLIVPGRGTDAAGLGDCLVLVEDWEALVRDSKFLAPTLRGKFLQTLEEIGNSSAVHPGTFTPDECMALIRAGFLVSSSSITKGTSGIASFPYLPSSTATSASTADRDDSENADETQHSKFHTATLFLSLPNVGPYLRLLSAGRLHLLSLLKRSRTSEVPLYLLRDRWNGSVESNKNFDIAKRARGEFAGILPGKTKKWKDLYGMSFHWVLEEALGAGLIEVFETGSVGPGVRCL